jgi:hypothetical protein
MAADVGRKKGFERKVRKGFRKEREGVALCVALRDFFALFALKVIGTSSINKDGLEFRQLFLTCRKYWSTMGAWF